MISKRESKLSSIDVTPPEQFHWTMALVNSIKDPKQRVKEDDKVIIIKDKYPKAQFHYLVIPKADIPSVWHVKKENKNLLLHMHDIAVDLTRKHKDSDFLIGYHAVPSMHRLHLHVISTDFNSPCLKTWHHWNSFTTPFFLPSINICEQLRETGELKKVNSTESARYLKTPLKCHKCPTTLKNMPNLKRHLLKHLSKPSPI